MSRSDGSNKLFNKAYHAAYAYASEYTACAIFQCLEEAGLDMLQGFTADEACDQLNCLPQYRPQLEWALAFLTQQQVLRVAPGERLYSLQACEEKQTVIMPQFNLNVDASLMMIDYVAANWLTILQGKTDPLYVLFGTKGFELWEHYFCNSHDLYAVHNQWAAESLADEIQTDSRPVILELGVGYGSGTRAFLSECYFRSQRIGNYVLSDSSSLLTNRAKNALAREYLDVSFEARRLDINSLNGLEEGVFDYIYAVNVIHCAVHIQTVVNKLRTLLKAGGCIVISECIRGNFDTRLHQEFIFSLLPGFANVNPDKLAPPCYGFWRAEDWFYFMDQAGFTRIEVEENQGGFARGALIKGWV